MQPHYSGWYVPPGAPLPHQAQHPQHHSLQQHPHPPPGLPGQPHAMPMSPRTQPPPLQGPSMVTQSHAIPSTMPHHSVLISDSNVDNNVTLYRLRRASGRPADVT